MIYKIGDIVKIYGGSTPCTKIKNLWKEEIPFLTPKFLSKNKNKFIDHSDRYITHSNYKYSFENDIFLTCRAPVGIVKINKINKCYFSQGIKRIVPIKDSIKNEYLFYWFIKNKSMLLSNSSGSTFLEISKNNLEKLKLNVPKISYQQHIIDILMS